MSQRVVVSLCFFVVSTFAFAERTAPKTVPIVTIDGERVFVSEKVLKQTYELYFGKRTSERTPEMSPQERLQLEREITAWAYSNQGLNLSRDDAQAFGEDIAQNPHGAEGFRIFKDVYEYAYSNNGLNLDRTSARAFAKAIVALPKPQSSLAFYKEAYEYAYSNQGLNMSREQARQYADRKAGVASPAPNVELPRRDPPK